MEKKQFYQFVIPSIGAMLVTGLYFVVDGIFVGRGIGTGALAAVNIAVPYISILTSISMMITMGGATITSIHFGKGENEKANKTFNLSLIMIAIFSTAMTLISVSFPETIATLLGASDLLLQDTATYIRYYVLFGVFFCGSMTLSAFVRNDGNPHLAFWGMIMGAVSNVFLDWLFIFPLKMGVMGAAIASGLGQLLACIVLASHFAAKKGSLKLTRPTADKQLFNQILKVGAPEFVTQMSQPVTILCYNYLVLGAFGEIGVSAFSVISYLLVIVIGVFTGLAQGIQPLLSKSYGEGNQQKEQFFFHKGLTLNLLLAIIVYGIMFFFGKEIIAVFNRDSQLIKIAYECISVYGVSFLFASVNIVFTIYYLATKRTGQAIMIAVIRSFISNTVFIFLIPALFGVKAIWAGMIVAEALVTVIAIVSRKRNKSICS